MLLGGAILAVTLLWGLRTRRTNDVLTAPATRGDLVITVTERGEMESKNPVQIMCEVEGGGAKLAMVTPEGTKVKKGDVVAQFDTDTLMKGINEQEVKWEAAVGKQKAAKSELEVQRNKAEGEVSKADTAKVLADIDHKSYEVGEYKVEVQKRKGELEIARKEKKEAEDSLDFTRNLVKKGFAPREQLRAMELNHDGKAYKVEQLESDLEVFQSITKLKKVTEFKSKADDAHRELERTKKSQAAATEKAENEAKAAERTAGLEEKHLARLKAQLERCVVKAPADGILIYSKQRWWDDSSRIRVGATIHFQQEMFTLPDLDNMQVKLKVHESVVKKVQKGMTATLQIEALGNTILHGEVLSVATLAQQDDWGRGGVKEYETVVSIKDLPTGAGLRPGMTSEVKILVKTVKDALTVPVSAVTESGGKHIAYVVTPTGIDRREVTIGEGNEQLVQILKGIADGERVALDARSRAAAELKAGEKDKDKKDAPAEPAKDAATPGGK